MVKRIRKLALERLPDRNPVKRTVVCEPELNKALEDYAQLYEQIYGEAEAIETLLPFMLSAFLAKDRAFVAFLKGRGACASPTPNETRLKLGD